MKHKMHRKVKALPQLLDVKLLEQLPPWEWPETAGEVLRKSLKDHRPEASESERLTAAELAGDLVVMNDEMATVLLEVAENPREPENLRAQAAVSLGPVLEQADIDGCEEPGVDEPGAAPISDRMFREIRERLASLYINPEAPKIIRRRCLEASVRAPDEWHKQAVHVAYESGDRDWTLTAVFAMRWVQGFDEQILESLENSDAEVRYEALNAAGNWQLDGAWSYIEELIEDPATSKELLIAAIDAAVYVRPREAVPLLAELSDSEDEEIAEAATEAVMMANASLEAGMDDDFDEDGDEEKEDEPGKWIN